MYREIYIVQIITIYFDILTSLLNEKLDIICLQNSKRNRVKDHNVGIEQPRPRRFDVLCAVERSA